VETADVETAEVEDQPPLRPALANGELETEDRPARAKPRKSKAGLIVGCLLGVVLLALVGGVAAVAYYILNSTSSTTQEVVAPRPSTVARGNLPEMPLPPNMGGGRRGGFPNPQLIPFPVIPGRNPNPGPGLPPGVNTEWKLFNLRAGSCSLLMPGSPERVSSDLEPKAPDYVVKRSRDHSEFHLSFFDLDSSEKNPVQALQTLARKNSDVLMAKYQGRVNGEREFQQGLVQGREVILQTPTQVLILRLNLIKLGNRYRVYRLIALGPSFSTGSGDANTFFSSFQVTRQR
jgi:hypothetical protein